MGLFSLRELCETAFPVRQIVPLRGDRRQPRTALTADRHVEVLGRHPESGQQLYPVSSASVHERPMNAGAGGSLHPR